MDAGATEVMTCATHAILSDPACDRLTKSSIKEIVTTNTIPLRAKAQAELAKIKVLTVASLLAEAIKRIHNEESVSSLFN
jgi:ribose-phosphate pyrophosphokinase